MNIKCINMPVLYYRISSKCISRDNPSLKNELLRELCRLKPHFGNIIRYFGNRVRESHLLSMEI